MGWTCEKGLKKEWSQAVEEMSKKHPHVGMHRLSGLFGVSRQAWYKALARQEQKDLEEGIIIWEVGVIRSKMPKIGSKKLHHELERRGIYQRWSIKMGRDKLNEVLSKYGLLNKKERKRAKTTNSNHPFRKYSDLLKGRIITGVNQGWASDITYIPIWQGFSYLSLITDVCSRKIVGWHLSKDLSAKGCAEALKKAITQAKRSKAKVDFEALVHHSDRGIQYCSHEYTGLLKAEKIRISMTQSGDPYDNALAERMNRIIKEEFLENRAFKSHQEAYRAIEQAIQIYNSQYPHGSLDYKTPNEVHVMKPQQALSLKKRWVNPNKNKQQQQNTQKQIANVQSALSY
jgi:putative transposase